jgi:hypothetical protein
MKIIKFFIVFLLGMVAMTVSAADTEENVAVNKNGYAFIIPAADAQEMKTANWSVVFMLNNSSSQYGDCCLCARTIDNKLYISSPDGTQEFIINNGKLKKTSKPKIFFDEGSWAEHGQPLGKNRAKYVFGYDLNDNVYVVVYGN